MIITKSSWIITSPLMQTDTIRVAGYVMGLWSVLRRTASGKALEGLGDLRDPRAGHDSETFSVKELEGVGWWWWCWGLMTTTWYDHVYNLHKLGQSFWTIMAILSGTYGTAPQVLFHTTSSEGTASCKCSRIFLCLFQSHTKESR